MNITVISQIDIPKKTRKINDDSFWTFAANEWHRLISPYTPFRTGTLDNNVSIKPREIHYNAPYAAIVYHRNANFRKDIHPLASNQWDAAAIAGKQDESLISSMQNYVKSGRLKLT